MYDILSLTNSTLLTADMILLCTKKPVQTIIPNNMPVVRQNISSPECTLNTVLISVETVHTISDSWDVPKFFAIYFLTIIVLKTGYAER
jgi:hypothetical protein